MLEGGIMSHTETRYSEEAELINLHRELDMREAKKRLAENMRVTKATSRSVQKLQQQLRQLAKERHEIQMEIDRVAKDAKDKKKELRERIQVLKNSGVIN